MSDVPPAPSESEPPPPPRPLTSARLGPALNHSQSAGLLLLLVLVGLTVGGLFVVRQGDPPSLPASELAKPPRVRTPRGVPRVRYVQDETDVALLEAQLDTLEQKVAKLEKALKAKDTEHDQALTSAATLVTTIEAAQRHHALHGGVYGGHYRISVLVGFGTAPAPPFVRVVWLPLEDGYDAEAQAVANRIAGYVRAYTTRVETVVGRDRR